MPKVSVILPVYNAEKYISRAIDSILTQIFRDFEFIIVANGSNNGTLDQIQAFDDPRIKLLWLKQTDVAAAMNYGIKQAKGEYIARMDADDISTKNRLEIQTGYLDNHQEDSAVTGIVQYDGDKAKNQGYYLHVDWLNSLPDHNAIYLNRFVDSPIANPSLMMRKVLFEKYGLYENGPFPEDYEMILRWLDNGIKIGKVHDTLLHWQDHENRLTRNHENYSQEAFYRIKTEYFAKWFAQYPDDEVLIWGTGKSVREKSRFLKEQGIGITGYIEVKKHFNQSSSDGKPVYHFTGIPKNKFILSYVSDRNGRLAIIDHLNKSGYIPGKDYYLMS